MRRMYLYDVITVIVFAIVASVFALSLVDVFDRAIEYELTTRTGNR